MNSLLLSLSFLFASMGTLCLALSRSFSPFDFSRDTVSRSVFSMLCLPFFYGLVLFSPRAAFFPFEYHYYLMLVHPSYYPLPHLSAAAHSSSSSDPLPLLFSCCFFIDFCSSIAHCARLCFLCFSLFPLPCCWLIGYLDEVSFSLCYLFRCCSHVHVCVCASGVSGCVC